MKVTFISGNRKLIQDLSLSLRKLTPDLEIAACGLDETEAAASWSHDLIIFDSDIAPDAPHLIHHLRELSDVPLMTVSRGEDRTEMVRQLEAGADDCVTERVEPIEFCARAKALVRRWQISASGNGAAIAAGDLVLVPATHQVSFSNKPVELSPTEYRVLSSLMRNKGRPVPHRELLKDAWGPQYVNDNAFLKKYIYFLRSKLVAAGADPGTIVSVRGIGYRLAEK